MGNSLVIRPFLKKQMKLLIHFQSYHPRHIRHNLITIKCNNDIYDADFDKDSAKMKRQFASRISHFDSWGSITMF